MICKIKTYLKFFLFLQLFLSSAFASGISEGMSPSRPLVEVLQRFGLKCGSWEEIVEETQKKWLRAPSQELWQVTPLQDLDPEKTYRLFSELGMTEKVLSRKKQYDTVAIFGVTKPEMEKRIRFLQSEWERGVRFGEIVFLVGDRPLDPVLEGSEGGNETGMAKVVFEKMQLPEWKNLKTTFVDTPRKEGQRRPTTLDTLCAWLETHPQPGSVLFISGQPFIQRQDLIARKALAGQFEVETIGNGVTLEEYKKYPRALSVLLDELARLIYEEKAVKKCSESS